MAVDTHGGVAGGVMSKGAEVGKRLGLATIAVVFMSALVLAYFLVGFQVVGPTAATISDPGAGTAAVAMYWIFGWIPEAIIAAVGFSTYDEAR